MLKLVSTRLNMHHILSSVLLCYLLTLFLNIRPVISAVNRKRAYDGSLESSQSTETIPKSKAVIYKPEFHLSAIIYLPQGTAEDQKLPLLVYYHGGGFLLGSPSDRILHNFLNIFVREADVIVVSVGYRLVEDCPFPCAYNDSWDALNWVASHLDGNGPVKWLNQHADFQRVFLSGDDAGANIAHQMALRLGVEEEIKGFSIAGMILSHPYFWGQDPIPGETTDPSERELLKLAWKRVCPTCKLDDPRINPATDPNLSRVASPRLQVFVSEKDELHLRERGWYYAQKLRQSGWSGHQEVIDFQGEGHLFQFNTSTLNATILRSMMATFINREWSVASMRMQASPRWSNALYGIIQMVGHGWK